MKSFLERGLNLVFYFKSCSQRFIVGHNIEMKARERVWGKEEGSLIPRLSVPRA